MSYRRSPAYLWRHASGLWFLKRPIPPALQKHYAIEASGKLRTHIIQSLGTHNRAEAEQLKRDPLRLIEAEFTRLGAGPIRQQSDKARQKLIDIREAMAEVLARPDQNDPSNEAALSALEDMAENAAEHIEKAHGAEASQMAYTLATRPDKLSLKQALAERHKVANLTGQTKDAETRALGELLAFLKVPDALPEFLTEARAVAFVDHLNEGDLSYATRKGRLSCLARLWKTRKVKGQLPRGSGNPWHEHDLKGEGKSTDEASEEEAARAWTTEEAVRYFASPDPSDMRKRTYTRPLFRELHVLGMAIGMRLDEITSLRNRDVSVMEWGVTVSARKGKTEASIRVLPVVHPAAVAILKRRKEACKDDALARLFSECAPGGKDRKTSHHVSKAMGRDRDRFKFGPEVNFHSTRKSWAKLTLELGLQKELRQQYIGHEADELIDNTYAQGVGLDTLRKKVAEAVAYPPELEAEFAKAAQA
jgi:integrase